MDSSRNSSSQWQHANLVERHGFFALDKWGDDSEPSDASLKCLQDLHKAAQQVPRETLLELCPRLRLLALFSKILSLFDSSQAHFVANYVGKWVTFIHAGARISSQNFDWEGTLRVVCNNCVNSTHEAFVENVALIRVEFIAAVMFINRVLLTESLCVEPSKNLPQSFVGSTAGLEPAQCVKDIPQASNIQYDRGNLSDNGDLEGRCEPKPLPSSSQRSLAHNPNSSDLQTSRSTPRAADGPEVVAMRISTEHEVLAATTSRSSYKSGPQEGEAAAVAACPVSLHSCAARDKKRKFENDRLPLWVHEQTKKCPQIVRSTAPHGRYKPNIFEDPLPPQIRKNMSWSEEEEHKLVQGHRRHGNNWELIRQMCGLNHRLGTQLREKWRNLEKAGQV